MNPDILRKKRSLADTLIHVDENLNGSEKENLVSSLKGMPGVISSGFNSHNDHLLIVAFDPEETRSMALLNDVKRNGYHAELIGL